MPEERKIVTSKRHRNKCPFFGSLTELNERVLPTVSDALKYSLFVKSEMKTTVPARDPTVDEISKVVAQRIESIWVSASISHISQKSIIQKLRKCRDKYRNVLQPYRQRRNVQNTNKKWKNVVNKQFLVNSIAYVLCVRILTRVNAKRTWKFRLMSRCS